MKKYLNEHWRWENYRDFFNITVFRYLVLWFSIVPLLASLFGGIESPLRIPIGTDREVSIDLGIPFAWQILWLSSLFFLSALGVYTFKCPAFIKKYHNFTEYQEVGHDPRWTVYEIRRLKCSGEDLTNFTSSLITKQFAKVTIEDETDKPIVKEKQTIYRYKSGEETIEVGAPILIGNSEVVNDAERGLFWEIFAAFSGAHVKTRGLILSLLLCSALCFILVLFQHIYHGWAYVITWIKSFLVYLV